MLSEVCLHWCYIFDFIFFNDYRNIHVPTHSIFVKLFLISIIAITLDKKLFIIIKKYLMLYYDVSSQILSAKQTDLTFTIASTRIFRFRFRICKAQKNFAIKCLYNLDLLTITCTDVQLNDALPPINIISYSRLCCLRIHHFRMPVQKNWILTVKKYYSYLTVECFKI